MARPDEDPGSPAQATAWASQAGSFTTPARACTINLREPHEVSAWTRFLGCSEERLRLAVAAVGPELEEVCNHLGQLVPAQPLNVLAGNRTAH